MVDGKEEIFTDGSCDNKNGDGACAVWFKDRNEWIGSGPWDGTTSARMEILGAFLIIKQLSKEEGRRPRIIYCDNQYVVNTIQLWWRQWVIRGIHDDKANYDIWERLFNIYYKHEMDQWVEVKWVKGHSGVLGNEKVDTFAGEIRLSDKKRRVDHKNGFRKK